MAKANSLPDDLANLPAASPEAEAALAGEPATPVPAAPAPAPEKASAAAKAGVDNIAAEREGTAAVPGTTKYVYGNASVTVITK
jgi:hypothetical protein